MTAVGTAAQARLPVTQSDIGRLSLRAEGRAGALTATLNDVLCASRMFPVAGHHVL